MNELFDNSDVNTQVARVTVVATDAEARDRATRGFADAGVGIRGAHLIGDIGVDHIDGGPVWLELARDLGKPLDVWLEAFNALVDGRGLPASVAVVMPMLDTASARLTGSVQLIAAPDPIERAGEIAMLIARGEDWLVNGYERRGQGDDAKLRRLSEEVARIAEALARMTSHDAGYRAPSFKSDGNIDSISAPVADGMPQVSAETVRATIRARRLREKFFEKDYFADPAWDMLLDLLAAEIAQHRVPVSSLCIAAEVPPTTALRWMKTLTDAGIFNRRADPHDGRRVFVELSAHASLAMRRYFAQLEGLVAA